MDMNAHDAPSPRASGDARVYGPLKTRLSHRLKHLQILETAKVGHQLPNRVLVGGGSSLSDTSLVWIRIRKHEQQSDSKSIALQT